MRDSGDFRGARRKIKSMEVVNEGILESSSLNDTAVGDGNIKSVNTGVDRAGLVSASSKVARARMFESGDTDKRTSALQFGDASAVSNSSATDVSTLASTEDTGADRSTLEITEDARLGKLTTTEQNEDLRLSISDSKRNSTILADDAGAGIFEAGKEVFKPTPLTRTGQVRGDESRQGSAEASSFSVQSGDTNASTGSFESSTTEDIQTENAGTDRRNLQQTKDADRSNNESSYFVDARENGNAAADKSSILPMKDAQERLGLTSTEDDGSTLDFRSKFGTEDAERKIEASSTTERSFKMEDAAFMPKATSTEYARADGSTFNESRSRRKADDVGERLEKTEGTSAYGGRPDTKDANGDGSTVDDSRNKLRTDDAERRRESASIELAESSKSVTQIEEAGGETRVTSIKDDSRSNLTESGAERNPDSSSTEGTLPIKGAGDKKNVASRDSRSKFKPGRMPDLNSSEDTGAEGKDDFSNVVQVISTLDDVLDQYDYPEYENVAKAPSAKNDSYRKALENIHLDLFTRRTKKISVPLFPRSVSGEDDMSDIDIELFENPKVASVDKEMSTSSLRSVDSIPGWHSFNLSKWRNVDDISAVSGGDLHGRWVVGDTDAESVNPSEPQNQEPQNEYATNSPPESIASSLATTLSSNIETDINLSKESSEIVENEPEVPVQEQAAERSFSPIRDEGKELETDWEYRLPSPPTAFRDSSPTTVVETEKFKGDSVVTSPELFEKLQLVQEAQSDVTASVVSEDEKSIYNKLSLEHLEKRKSLVYNRELATSLKCKDEDSQESLSSKRSSIMSELEEVIAKSTTLTRRQDNFVHAPVDSSLPNFKITTYDMPKKKINIFEDDSIRSNAENKVKPETVPPKNSTFKEDLVFKRPSFNDRSNSTTTKDEGIFRKPIVDEGFKRPEVNRYRARTLARVENGGVGRSESFSSNGWVPTNPVKRSKSQVAINQYKEAEEGESNGTLSKSNSLFDVSGLQSLEVIRSIQTKLNTPRNSTEELDRKEEEVQKELQEPEPVQLRQKTYQYRGPPSINLGTWSERPKSQISLKEDTDYKFGRSTASKKVPETTNVSVNGSQHISTQSSGNVVIKIGGGEDYNFTRRKPLGNVNKVEPRPHSVAYERQHFDISRVPIVRSVELKKPFKDMHISNTSITQICHAESKSLNYNGFYGSSETLNKRTFQSAPVVKGFKDYATNKNVPFSQCNLRRTDSNKGENLRNAAVPPPPLMPTARTPRKLETSSDPRGQLLDAIRSFGGKKGLRATKA